ncbi:hypothetical protein B5F38_02540 [Barnesiella sp. An22]|nr:hypothetical protein B5F38_02540 [Barnesiella sp. An22]
MLYLCMDFYKNGGKMQWYNDDIEQERRNEKSAHQFHRKRVAALAGRDGQVCASVYSVAVGILVSC